ncbi:ABC transporter ATP-binding protein/permease [Thiocapsa roseopersicina]|uniref:Putative ATP-binding cassette transporter n=1 Tax=Thiocapsa roseopersicina TaxID=1058 RepID=A0A1H2UEB5_THIRO|nr:SbmA/BacA-like family transporter [Thiocapsa roseopersicina]SDW54258.1 putative ATP-binding cassette transporter [Thiocapsa roseopersicina]
MNKQRNPDRQTAAHFGRAVGDFAGSEVGGRAKWMFAALLLLLFGINGMNVLNSYVNRDFMTAIADRQEAEFIRQALFYIAVFAGSTLLSVISRFTEERLALLWREFVTGRAIRRYLTDGAYYRLDMSRQLTNPDQRIAEDVRAFTVTTLSFVLMMLSSSFTVVAFSGVLWSISPLLFLVAVLYAATGSLLTIVLGRPLVGLNYDQSDREANFRSGLIHVREHAESAMMARSEDRLEESLRDRLASLVGNLRRIIGINRNLGFFTTGYNWMIQIIPALIIAPAFIDGRVEFGVITQSAMAFATLVAAFSLIISQFQSISSFAAAVARLESLVEAIEAPESIPGPALSTREEAERLAYEGLGLRSPEDGRPLLRDLSVSVPFGTRVLVGGVDQAASLALFRATAGLRVEGEGRIVRPRADDLLCLAERPYLPPGTLRQALVRTAMEGQVSDERILGLLRRFALQSVPARAGGLDTPQEWSTLLSLSEQQLLAVVRVILAAPRFAILDRPETALSEERLQGVLEALSEASITYLCFGRSDVPQGLFDAILDIHADGSWTWTLQEGTACLVS